MRIIYIIACLTLVSCHNRRAHYAPLKIYEEGIAPRTRGQHHRSGNYVLENYTTSIVTPSGELHSKSIGDIIYTASRGKWQKSYVLTKEFSFGHERRSRDGTVRGSLVAPKGSIWTDHYRDHDGTIFLTSAAIKRHGYAVEVDEDGSLNAQSVAYHIDRGHSIRQGYWLFNVPEGPIFQFAGMIPRTGSSVSGWGVAYFGLKDGLLRFKIFQINSRGEHYGHTIYEHDFKTSKEMVVRGVTLKLEKLRENGIIEFRISESPQN